MALVTVRSATTIDNILVSGFLDGEYCSSVLRTTFSDHYAQSIVFRTRNAPNVAASSVSARRFDDFNVGQLISLLAGETWAPVFAALSADEAFDRFMEAFSYCLDVACPVVPSRVRLNRIGGMRWMTPEILFFRRRLSMYADLSRNFPEFIQTYKAYNAEYALMLSKAKRMYYDNLVCKSSNKSKTVWSILKSGAGTSASAGEGGVVLSDRGAGVLGADAADLFNQYFVSSARGISVSGGGVGGDRVSGPVGSFCLLPVTPLEVESIVVGLKQSHSHGDDEISNYLLKRVIHVISAPLSHIISVSFATGIFPHKLKTAVVKPLFKGGDRANVSNYRPISLLSSISKILETFVSRSLMRFLSSNGLLNDSQHGYMTGRSVSSAHADFMNYVVGAMDQRRTVIGLFIDFSKAFDTVDHTLLLQKLEGYGVRGVALDWFGSYLRGRTQFVSLQGVRSRPLDVGFGVPQGSILGPTLFNVFVNDLPDCLSSPGCRVVSYADDTNVVITDESYEATIAKATMLLCRAVDWISRNRLLINSKKLTYVVFGARAGCLHDVVLTLDDTPVTCVDAVKFLGLWIDKNLTWGSHINHLCTQLSRYCYQLRSLSSYCSPSILKTFYFGSIEPAIRFGISQWGRRHEMERVFILQKRAVRFLCGLGRLDSCRQHFVSLKILTVPAIYIHEVCCFVYTNKKMYKDFKFSHSYETRNKNSLTIPQHRTSLFERHLFYNGCKFFNVLPNSVTDSRCVRAFRSSLKAYLITKCLYKIDDLYHV